MEIFGRLILVITQAYVILGVMLTAHSLRKRFGLDMLFLLVGGLMAYMWWLNRVGVEIIDVGQGRLPIAYISFFSLLVACMLIVYVCDGVRMARRLILSILSMQLIFLLMELILSGQLKLTYSSVSSLPPNLFRVRTDWFIWSSAALVLDLLAVGLVFQFVHNSFPRLALFWRVVFSLSAAMLVDSLLFVAMIYRGEGPFTALTAYGIAKGVMLLVIVFPVAWYLKGQVKQKIAVDGHGMFDIFRNMEVLRENLERTAGKYKGLMDQLNDGVMVMNEKGFATEANTSFFRITGATRKDLRAQSLHYTALIHPDDRPEVIHQHSIRLAGGSAPDTMIIKGKTLQGQKRRFMLTFIPVREADHRAEYQLLVRDVTDQYDLQKQLRKASDTAALADFKVRITRRIGELSRRLVPFFTDGDAKDELPDPDENRKLLAQLEQLTDALEGLSLPDDAREHLTANDILLPALETVKERCDDAKIKPEISLEEPQPLFWGLRHQWVQVMMHLLENACREVSQERTAVKMIAVSSRVFQETGNRRRLEILVRNGTSPLSEEVQRQLGEPFFTTEAGHMGLGLAFCRAVALDHGGELKLNYRESDAVMEVRLLLPLSPARRPTSVEM